MENLHIAARLDDEILIVNKGDLPYIGKERALEVMCITVDLEKKKIGQILELEKHLKFNAWEEVMEDEEREILARQLNTKFADQEIQEKIIAPLEEKKIQ